LPNPTLLELVNNVSTFNYYTGKGNFIQNKLPFGKDQPGGGSSGQPFVTTSPDDVDLGIIGEAFRDVKRVSKFLNTSKGKLFSLKQVGLQMMNPLPEQLILTDKEKAANHKSVNSKSFSVNASNIVQNATTRLNSELGVTRIYNPLNTNLLAQVAGSFIGEHFVRSGFSLEMDDKDKYTYIAEQNNKNDNNRLISLLRGLTDGGDNVFPKLQADQLYQQTKELFSYTGGAKSLYGIGSTSIKSYVSTFAAAKAETTLSANVVTIPETDMLNMDDNGVLNNPSAGGDTFDFSLQDFRAYKRIINPSAFPAYKPNTEVGAKPGAYTGTRLVLDTPANANKYNVYKRLGIININNADSFGTVYQDRLNAISLYYGGGKYGLEKDQLDMNGENVKHDDIRDLIKFRIKALDNDSINNGTFMVFRAFLNGAISDNTTATWNPIKYSGRGETFYSYDGAVNTMNFGFTIVAFSRQEMKPLYQKLTYLKSIMFPDYKANKMRGTIVEMTIGDYIKYQPGIITTLNITIPEDASWEIALDSPDENGAHLDMDMHELPMMLKVEMEFTPIWNFLPKKSTMKNNDYTLTPFIGIDKETAANNEWTVKPKSNPNTQVASTPSTAGITSNNTQGKGPLNFSSDKSE